MCVGALFVRAFERGERVYLAMASRGLRGIAAGDVDRGAGDQNGLAGGLRPTGVSPHWPRPRGRRHDRAGNGAAAAMAAATRTASTSMGARGDREAQRAGAPDRCGFVELAEPGVDEAIDRLVADGAHEIVVVPLVCWRRSPQDGRPGGVGPRPPPPPTVHFRLARDLGIEPMVLAIAEERIATRPATRIRRSWAWR